jgi:transcriptional regulator with PAS, ATPase and Fis domain
VLLDELGEMSLRMQAMLLRFLENGEIQPVGGEGVSATIDTRIVAATNRNLHDLVATGGFREDLLYRIKVVHLHVVPLRERREDIRPLIDHLIARLGRTVRFTDEALRTLEAYHWPGNIRELQNVIEQASWLGEHDELGVAELPPNLRECAATDTQSEAAVSLVDRLYEELASGKLSFWESVYPQFLRRDLTRNDVRELVRRGLSNTNGNYRALLPLFGVPTGDYKRFLNFLAAHECALDYRGFRGAPGATRRSIPN